MQVSAEPRSSRSPRIRAGACAALGGLVLVLALQAAAVQRGSVHWDEFALLHLADLSLASGQLEAGGRPGLAVALLLPLVDGCVDEMAVMHEARLLWLGITLLFLTGAFCWLVQLAPGEHGRGWDAALGVALLALPPAFLDSSLQVRTDQIALAGGAWGGAFLLASQRRPWLALAAGACFGIGLLGSQKVLYVAALAGLAAAGRLALDRDWRPGRALVRAGGTALGAGAVLLTFRLWAEASFALPEASPARQPISADFLSSGFSLFAFYRDTLGWSEYRTLLPELAPHALLTLGLALATLQALRARSQDAARLLLACAALALGLAVGLFHAAAFRYFWLTLGLFPAAAFALARRPLWDRLAPRWRRPAVAALVCALALPAALHYVEALRDTQRVQRQSLAFIHRNFAPDVAGFHPESGLFCQAGPQPLPTYFSQHIYQAFESPKRARNVAKLIARFREARVAFLLESFRLHQFPVEVRRFWDENYQPYRDSVFVAGRRLAGARGERQEFELLVPGAYRWLPQGGTQPLSLEGRVVAPGAVIELRDGPHQAEFLADVPRGLLLLALAEKPGEAPLPFYP